jgi:hypothetical protein
MNDKIKQEIIEKLEHLQGTLFASLLDDVSGFESNILKDLNLPQFLHDMIENSNFDDAYYIVYSKSNSLFKTIITKYNIANNNIMESILDLNQLERELKTMSYKLIELVYLSEMISKLINNYSYHLRAKAVNDALTITIKDLSKLYDNVKKEGLK